MLRRIKSSPQSFPDRYVMLEADSSYNNYNNEYLSEIMNRAVINFDQFHYFKSNRA